MDRSYGANVLGKYRLIAELGHGGMAEVFLAVARGPAGFNKLAVIKQIRPQLAEDPEFLAMFLDEARLAARLNHPNVVQTNEVGHDNGRYYIAMEYLEGQPLNRSLHRIGRENFPLAVHVRVLIDALVGLHYAHELTDYDGTPLEVVHRDMTPHNVFVTYDGHVKLVDFGIAKAMSSSSETRTGVLKGKVAYMAPEQARGERVDRRADVFSVGVMLWEAAVGRRLWKGVPDVAILARLVHGEIAPPRSLQPDILPELEAVILRALSFDREGRYATAADFQADLERVLPMLGDRASLRDAGRLLAEHFNDERMKIKSLVEAQIRDARGLPTDEYRAVELPVIAQSTSHSDRPSKEPSARTSGGLPSVPQQSTSAPGSLTAASTARSALPQPPSPPRRALIPLAAAGGMLLAVVLWFVALRGRTPEAAAPPAPAPAATEAPAPAAPPAPTTAAPAEPPAPIELRVAASPAEAKLFLDDEPLPTNPFTLRRPPDAGAHTLRVEAPGYQPILRSLGFDKSFDIEVALERLPPGKQARPPAGPAAPSPQDDMKRTGPRPTRPLDTTNPFTNP